MHTIPYSVYNFGVFETDFKDKLHSVCILQYVYTDDTLIKDQPHRNSKKGSHNSSFNHCKKSVLTRIKEQRTDFSRPTSVYKCLTS